MSLRDGRIEFEDELLRVIGDTLQAFEAQRTEPLSSEQRTLALCYLLGLMRSDLAAFCEAHRASADLDGHLLKEVERSLEMGGLAKDREQLERLSQEMARRGWVVD